MILKDYDEKFKAFVEKWGISAQMIVCLEECAELQKELTKILRGKINRENLAEEIADVYIMVRQIELSLKLEDIVDYFIVKKVERTYNKMIKQKNNNEKPNQKEEPDE